MKPKANVKASIKLREIQKVQKMLSSLIIGESHHQPTDAEITYYKGRELEKPSYSMALALKEVKFHWKILAGVLSRTPQGDHQIYVKTLYNNKHETLLSISNEMYDELKSMVEHEVNKQHYLTTFFVASPNQDMPTYKLMSVALLLLHKHKVPDKMATNYEFDVKGLDKVASSYCNTTYWFNNVTWEEMTLENLALKAFNSQDDTLIEKLGEKLSEVAHTIELTETGDLSYMDKLADKIRAYFPDYIQTEKEE